MSRVGLARRMDLVGLPARRLERLRLIHIGRDVRQDLRTGIGRDRGPKGPHQRVHRHPGDLAGEVPQRRIDRADRAIADGAVDQPHAGMDPLALQRVLAHQHRLQRADQLRPVHRRRVGRRAEERVSLQTAHRCECATGRGCCRRRGGAGVVIGRRDIVPGEDRQCDIIDFHDAFPSRWTSVTVPCCTWATFQIYRTGALRTTPVNSALTFTDDLLPTLSRCLATHVSAV